MGSYSSDDEALIGLARQLTDAYAEARRREDQDYACDEIAAFLAAQRLEAPSEALLAILDLPLTAETYPLVDEAQSTLARRGPAVVELLLEAVLGDVYDPDGPAPERAAETLDLMDRREAAQGLTEVLCGRGDDQLKGAAVDGLVTLGAFAEPSLAATLDDPRGGEWAQAALRQIRFVRDHPGVADDEGLDEAGGAYDESFVDDYGPADGAGTRCRRRGYGRRRDGRRRDGRGRRRWCHRRSCRRERPATTGSPAKGRPPKDRRPRRTRASSTTPTRTSSAALSRTPAGPSLRPNLAQRSLNTGFIFA